ncbi:Ras GTPase-activating-like protein rng2 [Colletotrichum spaethianum]|uniref:RBR-type E3 ubiquitin transferase n=1 Tax=Colletotrichum spaethianum TaxID=700344 RepID=A0AA37PB98_9PEZI|nr:Ras GTPase-activating-like protein rng2 [Colletotrichum spaethianum]GKT49024.1 Ras GTPase-activating-like protein rng2 [Colletotrichum spaethianum]
MDDEGFLKDYEPKKCPLCFRGLRKTKLRQIPCGHTICNNCVAESFRYIIKQRFFSRPYCHHPIACWHPFPDEWAKELLRPGEWTRYRDLADEHREKESRTAVYCPNLECNSYISVRRRVKTQGIAKCTCGGKTCILCLEKAHEGETCQVAMERRKAQGVIDIIQEEQTLKTMARMGCKLCPDCGMVIEKDQGCDSMRCEVCDKPFEWSLEPEFGASTDKVVKTASKHI